VYGPSNNLIATFGYTGNVGIGTTGLSEKLTVDGNILLGGDYNLAIDVTTNGNGKVGRTDRAYLQINRSNFEGFLSFHTTSTGAGGLSERMRITSGGNVGIGMSAPTTRLDIGNGTLTLPTLRGRTYQLSDVASANPNFIIGTGFNSIPVRVGDIIDLPFGQTRTVTAVTDTQLTVDAAWTVSFAGSNVEGRGCLVFQANNAERMRITSGGYSNFTNDGTYRSISALNHSFRNSESGYSIIALDQTSANPYGLFLSFSGADPNNTTNWLFRGYSYSSGTDLYFIYSNGTTGGRSDIRLKKNIVDATPKLDDLMKLRVVNYEWKQSIDGTKELGLIAQEVEQIFPKLVDTKPCIKMRKVEQEDGSIIEEEYEDGESKILKHSVLPFMTLKGLQELTLLVKEQQSQIESLKAEIQTLKQ
jgi:hypothetical protein